MDHESWRYGWSRVACQDRCKALIRWLFLGSLWPLACAPNEPRETTVFVYANQLADCPLPASEAHVELHGLGDFAPSEQTSELLEIDTQDATLGFPESTITVRGLIESERDGRRYLALGSRGGANDVELLFWPEAKPCRIARSGDKPYPVPGGGQGIGLSSDGRTLLLAGSEAGFSSAVSGALSFDTGSGEIDVIDPRDFNRLLWDPRGSASVSAFGHDLVVAGGVDPTTEFVSGRQRLRDSAEVYVKNLAGFDNDRRIELDVPRADHGTANTPDGGVLLIGGRTSLADGGEEAALRTIELLSSDSHNGRPIASLEHARSNPTVVTLSDGRLFVAGGLDSNGELVTEPEWLDSEGGKLPIQATGYEARFEQAFVGLPGGATLAVGGCEDRPARADESCQPCVRGCPPLRGEVVDWDAFWIEADGTSARLSLGDLSLPSPRLIAADEGAPWLAQRASLDRDDETMLYRFNPWRARFDESGVRIRLGTSQRPPLVSLDSGAFVWLEEGSGEAVLWGMRFSTRHANSTDLGLITLTDPEDAQWPLHLAPGSAPNDDMSARLMALDLGATTRRVLALGSGVWVTDTRYQDFELSVTLERGDAPMLLASPIDGRFAWPSSGTEVSYPQQLTASRRGSVLTLHRADASVSYEDLSDERWSLGLAPASDPSDADALSMLSTLTIRRGVP